jgi:hypothetical protein
VIDTADAALPDDHQQTRQSPGTTQVHPRIPGITAPPADETRKLEINARTRNALIRSIRCLGERGFALLTQRWQTLQHITASPGKIGQIARAALVLVLFEHNMLT